jgi:hypothetical protein
MMPFETSVAKLFSRPNWAILIQGRAQARDIDSKQRSAGFDNYSFAAQRRVLQSPKSGHSANARVYEYTPFCPFDFEVRMRGCR